MDKNNIKKLNCKNKIDMGENKMKNNVNSLLVKRLEELGIDGFANVQTVKENIGLISSKYIYKERVVLVDKEKHCKHIRDLTVEEAEMLYDRLDLVVEMKQACDAAIERLKAEYQKSLDKAFIKFGREIEVIK